MLRITGSILKREGKVILNDGKKAIIEWVEKSSRHRKFHYIVYLQGKKFTKPTRLKPYELDYWFDSFKILGKGV